MSRVFGGNLLHFVEDTKVNSGRRGETDQYLLVLLQILRMMMDS